MRQRGDSVRRTNKTKVAVCREPVKVYVCRECGATCRHLVCEALGLASFKDKCPGCFQWAEFSERTVEVERVA